MIRDHPIASVGPVTVTVGVVTVTVGLATVACAVVRNSELFTGFPKPAYAEIEIRPFSPLFSTFTFPGECEELTAISLVAGIATSDETLLGDKVVEMILRETFVVGD